VKPPRVFTSLAEIGVKQSKQGSRLGSLVVLSAEDSHHLRDVLRRKINDPVEICDTQTKTAYLGTITALSPAVSLLLAQALPEYSSESSDDGPKVSLLFALSKGEKNDQVCDWGTELGCSQIILWQSERSVVRLKTPAETAKKESRLQRIAVAAAKQSRQPQPPTVLLADDLSCALTSIGIHSKLPESSELRLCCSLAAGSISIRAAWNLLLPPQIVHLVIGPEGDLAPKEESILKEHGFISITLGKRVLRSELAAVSAVIATRETFKK
jgi:16S rRNA (uracil1498-N3)-methyltransferase